MNPPNQTPMPPVNGGQAQSGTPLPWVNPEDFLRWRASHRPRSPPHHDTRLRPLDMPKDVRKLALRLQSITLQRQVGWLRAWCENVRHKIAEAPRRNAIATAAFATVALVSVKAVLVGALAGVFWRLLDSRHQRALLPGTQLQLSSGTQSPPARPDARNLLFEHCLRYYGIIGGYNARINLVNAVFWDESTDEEVLAAVKMARGLLDMRERLVQIGRKLGHACAKRGSRAGAPLAARNADLKQMDVFGDEGMLPMLDWLRLEEHTLLMPTDVILLWESDRAAAAGQAAVAEDELDVAFVALSAQENHHPNGTPRRVTEPLPVLQPSDP